MTTINYGEEKSSMPVMKKIILIHLILTSLVLTLGEHSTSKVQASPVMGWRDIAAGYTTSVGIKNDGTVWAWGASNKAGSFGNGEKGDNAINLKVPVQVKGLIDVIALSAGEDHALALKSDGTVWAWGNNDSGQIGDGTKTESTFRRSTGNNSLLELSPDIDNNRALPTQVKGLSGVVAISATRGASYALKNDGTLWYWGYGYNTPIQLDIYDVAAFSMGLSIVFVIKKDGTVWTYFHNEFIQISLSDITAVAEGEIYSYYALRKDGSVWTFSYDEKTDTIKKPEKYREIEDVTMIESSAGGILYLKMDGSVWASGSNQGGRLGIGSYENSETPVQVKGLMKIKKITAHMDGLRSMALRQDGTLWSWGNGYTGDGTEWYRLVPVWIKSYDTEPAPPAVLITVMLDQNRLEFEQQPIILNSVTMVPLRKISEFLSAKITWDSNTSKITVTKDNNMITLIVGNEKATQNEMIVTLDTPPTVINDRTFVPLRFIGESFGVKVEWDAITETVILKTK